MKHTINLPTWLMELPYEGSYPPWLLDVRQKAWEKFLVHGLPTYKDERWKYTDLQFLTNEPKFAEKNSVDIERLIKQNRLPKDESILIVIVDGCFNAALSDVLPAGLTISDLHHALETHADVLQFYWGKYFQPKTHYPFVGLNTARFSQGLFLHLAAGCQLEKPVQLVSFQSQANIIMPLNFLLLEKGSKLSLLETSIASPSSRSLLAGFTNAVNYIFVGPEAQLTSYKSQQSTGTCLTHTFVHQQKDSKTEFVNFIIDCKFSRDDLTVNLYESGANCYARGFYHLDQDNQYVDHHIDIKHSAPHSQSEMLYKGILNKKSRAVFNGRLQVEKQAQHTRAYQGNHNVLLSSKAEVYSKPELEIYANDVACKHGATTGQLDEEALFFLRARGIPENMAADMLLQGFANEILGCIKSTVIKNYLQTQLAFAATRDSV